MSNLQKHPNAINSLGNKSAFKHGMSNHRLFRIWSGIKNRCNNKKSPKFKTYGNKGIKICQEWKEFIPFMEWALANGYRDNLEIDRFPNKSGDYEPGNCRWVTSKQNQRNRNDNRILEIFGEKKCMAEWVEDCRCKVKRTTFRNRLNNGWNAEMALTKTVIFSNRWHFKIEVPHSQRP